MKHYKIEGELALLTRGTSADHRLGANLLEIVDLATPDVAPLW